jgi:hypothetical protein
VSRTRMAPGARAALTGAVAAVVVLAVAAAGAWLYLRQSGALSKVQRPKMVVVVFSGRAQDGALVAQAIVVTSADGSGARVVAPETSATVTGTTYGTLRDAYPFGGAAAVAKAVASGSEQVGWVDVPEKAWWDALDGSGGASVDLPKTIDVFDGSELYTFPEGSSTVRGDQASRLMNGIDYLAEADRARVRDAVTLASLKAMAESGGVLPAGCSTNLSAEAYRAWVAGLR